MQADLSWLQLVEAAAVILGPGGAVFIAMKGAMNGLKDINKEQLKLLREMRDDVKEAKRDIHEVRDAMPRA